MLDSWNWRRQPEQASSGELRTPFPAHTRRPARRSSRRLREAFGVLGIGVLVAGACVVGLLAVSWIQAQGAVAVVKAQAQAIRDGKVEQAYALFSSEYRSGMTLPMFRRWLRRQDRLAGIQGLRIWGRSAWRGTAVLWGSFQDEQGRSYPVRYSLVRENGGWRIDSFQVRDMVPDSLPNTERFQYI